MKQRVAIARSLAYDPDILLMDEPFAALDAQTRDSLQDELVRIWQATGKTIVFITHGIDEAVYLGRRVAVMTSRPGRIKQVIEIELGDRGAVDDVRSLRRLPAPPARDLDAAARRGRAAQSTERGRPDRAADRRSAERHLRDRRHRTTVVVPPRWPRRGPCRADGRHTEEARVG